MEWMEIETIHGDRIYTTGIVQLHIEQVKAGEPVYLVTTASGTAFPVTTQTGQALELEIREQIRHQQLAKFSAANRPRPSTASQPEP